MPTQVCIFNPNTNLVDLINGASTFTGSNLDAGKPVVLNANGGLDSSFTGNPVTAVAAVNVAAGQLINLYNNAGVVTARLANAANASSHPAHGFVTTAALAGATITVFTQGLVSVTYSSGFTNADVGSPVYLSTTTSGFITKTAPSAPDLVQPLGYIYSVLLSPSVVTLFFLPNPLASEYMASFATTSGICAVGQGGTGVSLSATGGAHQVLKQTTVGGTITVAQLAYSDISGTPPPAGTTTQVQFNNAGVLTGASGVLTNGTHLAFGSATIDGGVTATPNDGTPLPAASVLCISETSTNANLENGISVSMTLNPVTPPTNVATGALLISNAEGNNWNGSGVSGMLAYGTWNGSGTGASAFGLLLGVEFAAVHTGSGEITYSTGAFFGTVNAGSGTIDLAGGSQPYVTNTGTGTVTAANIVDPSFLSVSGTTVTLHMINVESPALSGSAAVTTGVGVFIDEQGVAGVTTPYQIYSTGISPSYFAGSVAVPYILPQTIYSAAGTPLPVAAAGLKGAVAIVSDATTPTYMTAYTSGGTITCQVICSFDGATYSWLTK